MNQKAALDRSIPSLDGLRAISIFLVLAMHSIQRASLHRHVPRFAYVLFNGGLGVKIFFVISGYLITRLLLREYEQRGTISLNRFYLRRAFRILPALYLYVAFLGVLDYFGKLRLERHTVVAVMLFFRNYDPRDTLWALEHTWTLCIEEQFYLLWPAILVWILLRRKGPQARALAARILMGGIVLFPIVRLASFLSPITYLHNSGMFQNGCDAILFGCLAAVSEGTELTERIYRWVMRYPWLAIFVLYIGFGLMESRFGNTWNFTIGNPLQALLITCILLWAVREPQTLFGRMMNVAPMRWFGTISYSLYLWQTFFLHYMSATVFGGDTVWNTFPVNWLMILLAAVGSFYLVEQPMLRLRNVVVRRFSPVAKQNAVDSPGSHAASTQHVSPPHPQRSG